MLTCLLLFFHFDIGAKKEADILLAPETHLEEFPVQVKERRVRLDSSTTKFNTG
jgi:hypothetical protein